MTKYALGFDFGTLSVRAGLVDIISGEETAHSESAYPHAVLDTALPGGRKLPSGFALQDPADYLICMKKAVREILNASANDPADIIGIGIDFTSSTILPVKKDGTPLAFLPQYKDEPHAYVKLWKHHGAEAEGRHIESVILERNEPWFVTYGGKVSGEWMLPKVLETLRKAPEVYRDADRFTEGLDWVVRQLTGNEVCSVCGAGYKMFYHGSYPSRDFFAAVDPNLADISGKLPAPIKMIGERAGRLTEEMADQLGLIPDIAVGTGIIDAHASVLGAGIDRPGTMMIVLGTSACHLILSESEKGIPGVGGLVYGGILPGYYGYEAGQCCVGDLFEWFTENCVPARLEDEAQRMKISLHGLLAEKLAGYKAGQSGLVALDWFNGVRTPLNDYDLNGLIVGLNLHTKPEEIYMTLIEATAFGTRAILEQFENAGIPVKEIILGGGIPARNKLLVRVFADICGRNIRVCGTDHASCLGAAMLGIAAAGQELSGYSDIFEIVRRLGRGGNQLFVPDPQNARVYNELYNEYKALSDLFGRSGNGLMKRLNNMRRTAG